MSDINNFELLELIEEYVDGNGNGWVEDETDLSDRFDDMIEETANDKLKLTFINGLDLPMLNEEFSNYADSLCKDGVLHSEQYSNYCYVGRFES